MSREHAGLDVYPELLQRVDGVLDDLPERLIDRPLHSLGERIPRALEAREIREYELPVVAVRDPEDATARRLRLVGDDRDLPAAQRVDERGLADVRSAGEGDEAAPQRRRLPIRFTRLLRVPTRPLLTRQRNDEIRACG